MSTDKENAIMTALEGQFKKVKDCDLDDFKSIKLDTLDALHDIYKSINRRKSMKTILIQSKL